MAVATRVASVRSRHDGRPLVLTTPGSVNWATGGLSDPIDVTAASDPVWVVISNAGRTLVTNVIEAPRLERDADLASLGWDVVAVPWFDADAPLRAAAEVAGVAPAELLSDQPGVGSDVTTDVVTERMALTGPERDDLRDLGSVVASALEAGVSSWRPGRSTDADVAAAISAELERHRAKAVCLIVGGDDRLRALRHPLAVGDVVREALMAVVVARRGGLHVAATRLCVTNADDPIVGLVDRLDAVHRAVLDATTPGASWGDAVDALAAGYAAMGQPNAWREHFQGGPIAYVQREFELAPGQNASPYWPLPIRDGVAVAWNPSLSGGAKIEETYLVGGDGLELVTSSPGWERAKSEGPARSAVRVWS